MYIAAKYAFFALIATACNIGAQDVATRFYAGFLELYVSIFVGTLTGLVVKYVLDKKYIFNYRSKHAFDEGLRFILYSVMGVVTTLIFWGMEIGFDYAFGTKAMRYVGGALGLAVGYYVKYRLDKRFVFVESS